MEISKTQMELANKRLERLTADIDFATPTFRGVPVTAFDKEHLEMLCSVYANEWQKSQAEYWEVLKGEIPTYIERARKTLSKPTFWRKIWNRIKYTE